MIHLPASAQIAKIQIHRQEAAAGEIPLQRSPGRNGPVHRIRQALAGMLVRAGSRLDDSRVWRSAPAGDPCP